MGWKIVPCHSVQNQKCTCRNQSCPKPGKHPRLGKWPDTATSDVEIIREWWKKWPDANVGVATGERSGIIVFDFDGEEGEKALEELAKRDPSILATRVHRSGSGGTHLFFQSIGIPVKNAVRRIPGMDVRGNSGMIIVPPSDHVSGEHYSVISNQLIAELPASLRSFLFCHKEDDVHKESNGDKENEDVKNMKQGKDEKKGAKTIGLKTQSIPSGLSDQIELAVIESVPHYQGQRHKQVFEFARCLLAIEGISQEIPAISFRPFVQRWFHMALTESIERGFSINGDFEETWSDFTKSWGKVQYPKGASLRPVFDHVMRMHSDGEVEPIAWNALDYFGRTAKPDFELLIGVLYELSKRAGGQSFSLACTAAAIEFSRLRFGNVTSKWIHRRLGTFVAEGILQCIDIGKAGAKGVGKPALYLWAWISKTAPVDDHGSLAES
jgi:hypothetical protein